jgi:hypothetical protein
MTRLPVLPEAYVKPDICGPCGGQCCRHFPGAAFPEDFGAPDLATLQFRLVEAFATGRWAIDCWDGVFSNGVHNPKYVRPAVSGDEGYWFDRTYGGHCTFWSQLGCEIFEQRPTGCRGLEPQADHRCEVKYGGKQDSIAAWIPYQKVLEDLLSLED